MDAPRRKSMAGPPLTSIKFDNMSSISSDIDSPADEVKLTKEKLIIDGRINIVNTISQNKDILCCKYSEQFDFIAAGTTDGFVKVYQSETGEFVMSLYDPELLQSVSPVTEIQHRPVSKNYPINNCFTCTYANGFVKCWNYNFNQCVYTIRENRQTYGITYHPNFPKFITYGDDGHINLYDEESKIQERILGRSDRPKNHDGHISRVFAACFHPRSNHELLTGGWDNVVHFWDLRQAHAVRHLSGVYICGEGIDINQKGTEILTCAFQKDKAIQLWDYKSGNLLNTIEPDEHRSKAKASITGLPTAIYCMDKGPPKKLKKGEEAKQKNEFTMLPKMAFTSGKKLYQVDFY